MNNLMQKPMQAAISATLDGLSQPEKNRKPLRLVNSSFRNSLFYSAMLSVLSPISAIGVLTLLSHVLVQR